MKISELTKRLQNIMSVEGDIEVDVRKVYYTIDANKRIEPITDIELELVDIKTEENTCYIIAN